MNMFGDFNPLGLIFHCCITSAGVSFMSAHMMKRKETQRYKAPGAHEG